MTAFARRFFVVTALAGFGLFLAPGSLPGQVAPQTYPNEECQGLVPTVQEPQCSDDACSFLGPYCPDEACKTYSYSGGDCAGSSETDCVLVWTPVNDKYCRDCGCSGFFGNCGNTSLPAPSGTRNRWVCHQAP